MDYQKYVSELSRCVRCGSCKALCATYDEDATEAMGARGRIALLWGISSGRLAASPAIIERVFSCTLCGACSGLCPTGVDIKELIYHGRNLLRKSDRKRKYLRFLTKFSLRNTDLSFKLLSLIQHFFLPYLSKKGIIPFQPDVPEYRFKDNFQVMTVPRKKGRVAVFTGCTVNFLYPHLGESLVNVLQNLGYEVVLPAGEVCCGAPLRSLGLEEEAVKLAKRNIGIFSKLHVEAVLSLCPACTLALKEEYPKLAGEGIDKVTDISEFFIDKIKTSRASHLSSHAGKALYHDPCHLKYGLGITKEPRDIIRDIGIDLIEAREELCCGFAGIFCFSQKELSKDILNKCTGDYMKTEAEMIITSCPGCIMQLAREIKNKPVVHLIEVIEEAMIQ